MNRRLFSLFVLIAFSLAACNMPAGQDPNADLALTITAQALLLQPGTIPQTQPGGQQPEPQQPQASSTPQFTPTPEFTATPSLTFTPTVPQVTVSQNTNCRTGPGQAYDIIDALLIGQTAEVVGKNASTNSWIIKRPNGSGNCWLWGQYATVTGNTANLPEYPIPATPTPALPAPVKNLNAQVTCVMQMNPVVVNLVNVKLSWTDQSNNEEGFRVYRDGALLVSLAPGSTSYEDNTTLAAIWLIGDPQPSRTYGVQAYNGAGESSLKEAVVKCP